MSALAVVFIKSLLLSVPSLIKVPASYPVLLPHLGFLLSGSPSLLNYLHDLLRLLRLLLSQPLSVLKSSLYKLSPSRSFHSMHCTSTRVTFQKIISQVVNLI